MRIVVLVSVLLLMTGSCFAKVDSTRQTKQSVKPAVKSYLLTQGTVTAAGNTQFPIPANLRCDKNTVPELKTSIMNTYVNAACIPMGLVNSLQLGPDYVIRGQVYMSNQACSASDATASWQVWCKTT
jgi:hypothetical protein